MTVLLCVSVLAGCGAANLTSIRPTDTITVDGLAGDWHQSQTYLDRQSMFIGIANDDSSLYILVKTIDLRAQKKVLQLGMTMWIYSAGNQKHRIGIHYPIGIEEPDIPVFGSDPPAPPEEDRRKSIIDSLSEIELIIPDEEPIRMPVGDSRDVRVAVRDTSEMVVYELRVPLRRSDSSYGIVSGGLGRIVIEAETGDIRPPLIKTGSEDGPRRRETTGMLRNKGRQERSSRTSPMTRMNPLAEPIKFTAKVNLAKAE